MYQDYIVGEHQANKGKRLLNFIIDYAVVIILTVLFFSLIAVIVTLINPESAIIYQLEKMDPLVDRILTVIIVLLFYFLIESITKGRSLGKLITGTKVVMIDGSAPTTKDYLVRNLCRAIPFDPFSFLGANGWHDKFSKTAVVNKKAFEADLLSKASIESIGNAEISDISKD